MNTKRHKRGAALIVALAVLVVLLALAITFLTTSRLELQVATNVEEQLRTELLANGGLAIAIAFLQHDLITHPTYTSLDHAWKTYFNGAWAAGKPWMFPPEGPRLWNNGVPIVSMTDIAQNFPPLGDLQPLYAGSRTRDWLYMPIVMNGPTALFPPVEANVSGTFQFDRSTDGFFVISEQVARNPGLLGPGIPNFIDPIDGDPRPRLASELTDIWADVDNTGDGVKDAMWIPVPQDIDFSDDGIDNDLNGVIDNPGEIARFLYWDPELERLMLTSPLVARGMAVLNGINMLELGAVDPARLQQRYAIPDDRMAQLLAEPVRWTVTSAYGHPSVDRRDNDHDFIEGNARTVDLRNELDPENLTVVGAAMLQGANPFDFAEFRDLFPIHPRYTLNIGPNPFEDNQGNPLPFIYSSGEPVTEVVGRLAITINDAASRVDIGAAGGFAREASFPPDTLSGEGFPYSRVRSIGQGVTPFEYETRVLPAFGPARAQKLWNLIVGAPHGLTNDFVPQGQPLYDAEYEFDVRFPGLGLVDDNASSFALAQDGLDNDGTGLIDAGFRLGSPLDPVEVRQRYYAALGQPLFFEGVDEPGEYRRFRPHRNLFAESDGVDNNPPLEFIWDADNEVIGWNVDPTRPSMVDEVGELGDLALRSKEQIKQIVENERFVSGQRLYDIVRNLTTVHATHRTERRRFTNAFGQTQRPDASTVPERGDITGTKLDLNHASVQQIFDALTEDFGYPSLYEEFVATLNTPGAPRREDFPNFNEFRMEQLLHMQDTVGLPLFALGLGVEPLNMRTRTPLDQRRIRENAVFGTTFGWAADERLRAAQLAVNIADFRDSDHNRTTFTFTVPDLWWELEQREDLLGSNPGEGQIDRREIEFTVAGIESIRINEIMPRPVRRVEAEMLYGVAVQPPGMPWVDSSLPVTSQRYLTAPDGSPGGPGEYDPLGTTGSTYAIAPTVQYESSPLSIFTNFNPNYFSVIPGQIPFPGIDDAYVDVDPRYRAQGFPDFRMTQRALAWWNPGAQPFDPGTGQLNDPSTVYNPVQPNGTAFRENPDTGDMTLGINTANGVFAEGGGGWHRVWSKRRVIGNDTALYTDNDRIRRVVNGTNIVGPNFAEFEFLPSPGLPPGRYYLKLNTALLVDNAGQPAVNREQSEATGGARLAETVSSGAQLFFVVKYDEPGRGFVADVAENGQAVLNEMDANAQSPIGWEDLQIDGANLVYPAQAGIPGFLGAKTALADYMEGDGTVFLPFPEPHFGDFGVTSGALNPQGSFTVTIPDYTANLALHIAVWKANDDGQLVAINHFEFSQEPAHEWVEIVNIAEDPEPIDLSGWVLEVGHHEDEGFTIIDQDLGGAEVQFDSLRRRFRVPDGTRIAPGGKLLLGFSKFDFLGAPEALVPRSINRNGMALANTGYLLDVSTGNEYVPGLTLPESSVPPIPMGDPRLANDLWPMGPPLGAMVQAVGALPDELAQPGSVFRRILFDPVTDDPLPGSFRDFVDDTGDGLDDQRSGRLDAAATFDPAVRPEELGASYRFSSTPFDTTPIDAAGTIENKAYDRIVQLEPIDAGAKSILEVGGKEAIARTVLAGGVFPHYPERDGRDNDMDGTRTFDPLVNDSVDNDLTELLNFTGGTWPVPFLSPRVDQGVLRLESGFGGDVLWPSEGVDEGAPGFSPFTTTARVPQPGAYSPFPIPYQAVMPNPPHTLFAGPEDFGPPNFQYILVGGDGSLGAQQPPELKAFLERRWNPGDTVQVTLYTGQPNEERVADRVKYSERDIVNRAVHDGIASPYQRWNVGDATLYPVTLDPAHPTMWPDDTMGVDFYRSLERHHPLYTGDLYGAVNRWTATDGNYDDWDAGLGKKDANLQIDPLTGAFLGTWGDDINGLDRFWSGFAFDPDQGLGNPRQDILIGHQLEASPLRKNFSARLFENPVGPRVGNTKLGFGPGPELGFEGDEGGRQFQFTQSPTAAPKTRDPYALTRPAMGGPERNPLKRWTWHKARVRNRGLASAGDLMSLPHFVGMRTFQRGTVISFGSGGEPWGTQRNAVASVLAGEERQRDLTAMTAISLMEPKILTAGQANVYFLTGAPAGPSPESPEFEAFDVGRAPSDGWPSGTPLTGPGSFPQGWVPVLLHNMPTDAGILMEVNPFQQVVNPTPNNVLMHINQTEPDVDFFLRRHLVGTNVSLDDLNLRSSQRSRVAFWASANLPDANRNLLGTADEDPFDPDALPAEVLFEWTGDAGLENGDYEVYIVTAEPLDGLAEYANTVLDNTFQPDPSVFPLGSGATSIDSPEQWRDQVQRRLARALTPTALAVLQQAAATVPSSLPVDVEILTDRDGNRRVWSDPIAGPEPVDFREGGALDGEAINPESAGLLKRAVPDSQGVIHYGQVRVHNNYLALRLRNWAQPGRLNRFSRVVLAPVNRVRGRLNINTVATVRDPNDLGNAPGPFPGFERSLLPNIDGEPRLELPLFNPLQGLPGIITASYDELAGSTGTINALDVLRSNTGSPREIDVFNQLGLDPPPINMYDRSISMADRIVQQRPDWGDGRYYRYPSDLVAWEQRVPRQWLPNQPRVRYGNEYPHYPSEAIESVPIFEGQFQALAGLVDPPINRSTLYWLDPERGVNEYGLIPGSTMVRMQYALNNSRFDENQYRFSRMANHITTRSDVFEIVVTAQSGYVPITGERGEGVVNYRNEFVVQGEQKIRVIYER